MKRDVMMYVKGCHECQISKSPNRKEKGLMSPMPIPARPWEHWEVVTLDFVSGLPTVDDYNCILIAVDKYSKYVHLIPSKTTYSSQDVANIFFNRIIMLHGMPKQIISDRDSKFTSDLRRNVFHAFGTQLHFATTLHPQTDGQSEVAVKTISNMLRVFTQQFTNKWLHYLPVLQLAYNNSVNESTKNTPYFLNSGFHPMLPPSFLNPCYVSYSTTTNYMVDLYRIRRLVRNNLLKAQEKQTKYYNRKRRQCEYYVNDRVLVHITQFHQFPARLQARWVGPFTIIKKYSPLVYRLQLDNKYPRKNNVFHISTLKKYFTNNNDIHIYQSQFTTDDNISINDNDAKDDEEDQINMPDIDQILCKKSIHGVVHYLLSFKGKNSDANI